MRSQSGLSFLLPFALLTGSSAQAWEFSCSAVMCVIPRNSDGAPNGIETCYQDRDKKEKIKEVSWKNGIRQGVARCFEKGKVKTELTFEKNLPHGFIINRGYDSRGARYVRYDHGEQLGFEFFADDKENVTDVWKCFKDEKLDESANNQCFKADYGPFQKKMQAVFSERFRQEQERLKRANGPQEHKYADGRLRSKFTMKAGQMVGEFVSYHPNGQLERKESYDDKGQLDGASTVLDSEGRKKFESRYEHGRLASQTEYLQNGKPVRLTEFLKQGLGTIECATSFWANGAKSSYDCYWANSWRRADGKAQSWSPDGQLTRDGLFKDAQPSGLWRYFYDDGVLRSEVLYKDGRVERTTEFAENGDRTETTFFPDGSVKAIKKIPKGIST